MALQPDAMYKGREHASPWSVFTFYWVWDFIKLANARDLTEGDATNLPQLADNAEVLAAEFSRAYDEVKVRRYRHRDYSFRHRVIASSRCVR